MLKEFLYYQPLKKSQIWHYLDKNNHWKQNYESDPSFIRDYISDFMQQQFNNYGKNIKKQLLLETKGSEKYNMMEKHIENTAKVVHQCETSGYVGNVIVAFKGLVEYKIGDDRLKFDEKLDLNQNVFAFNNKLYDMTICEFRNILPGDFIITSTNHTLNDSKAENMKYIETCLRNFHNITRTDDKKDTGGDNMFKYMLYCMTASLWGDNSKCPFVHI